jgi:hypothetical protein
MISAELTKQQHYRLESLADLDPLLEEIGEAQYVLLGEASHGTHQYYSWRTASDLPVWVLGPNCTCLELPTLWDAASNTDFQRARLTTCNAMLTRVAPVMGQGSHSSAF